MVNLALRVSLFLSLVLGCKLLCAATDKTTDCNNIAARFVELVMHKKKSTQDSLLAVDSVKGDGKSLAKNSGIEAVEKLKTELLNEIKYLPMVTVLGHLTDHLGLPQFFSGHGSPKVLKLAKKYLDANSVHYKEGPEELVIVPEKDGAPLNKFANEVNDRWHVKVVYAPEDMIFAKGAFDRGSKEILLSHAAIAELKATPTEVHEKLHARFYDLERRGVLSPFHIEFSIDGTSTKSIVPGSIPPIKRITAEEISCYTVNLSISASRLKRSLKKNNLNSHEVRQYVSELRGDLNTSLKVIKSINAMARQCLNNMAKNPKHVTPFIANNNVDVDEAPYLTFQVDTDGYKTLVPGITLSEAEILAEDMGANVSKEDMLNKMQSLAFDRLGKLVAITDPVVHNLEEINVLMKGRPTTHNLQRVTSIIQQINVNVNSYID